ncbi:MAG: XrtA system polysaccharide deacetylase [Candidatus Zixiibacteriota bacterium]
MSGQLNLLTVDLEEWYVVEALTARFGSDQWQGLESTVVRNTRVLLDLFEHKDVRATFFILGWCAERHPQLIAEIAERGHEVACHSYQHVRVDKLTPEAFREDTVRAIDAIVKACGVKPRGYRAPSWSINPSCSWAFRILAELGFDYDSSIFPIKHDIYGMPDAPRQLFRMSFDDGKQLWEFPCATFRIFGYNLPLAGGGYLRHSPYWYSAFMINRLNRQGMPAMVYIHPWEIDPEPPKIEGLTSVQKFRTYGSTDILGRKLYKLLSDYQFTTISDYVSRQIRKPIGFAHS